MEFFVQLMKDGGPVMWIISICTLLALFLFLAKVFQFHREEINIRDLLRGLFNVLRREGLVEALTLCDNTPGPVARLLSAGILAHQRGDKNIRQAMDDAALDELPKLERHIALLGTFSYILPMLGLLGTILGLLNAFEFVQISQAFSIREIGAPVASALITSAAGLSAAIPCHVAYNYLVGRVDALTLDMEKAALELTAFFDRQQSGSEEAAEKGEER